MNNSRSRKWIWVVGILLLSLGIWGAVLFFSRLGLNKLQVKALPADSRITLDGRTIKSGTIYVKPGTYTLTASRQYFGTVTKVIDTRKGTNIVYLLPIPNSAAALEWLSKHPDVQYQREALGGADSENTQQSLTATAPIIKKLPFSNFQYRVDYSIDSAGHIAFQVTLYPSGNPGDPLYQQQLQQYKASALQFLQSNGISPDAYTISFAP